MHQGLYQNKHIFKTQIKLLQNLMVQHKYLMMEKEKYI